MAWFSRGCIKYQHIFCRLSRDNKPADTSGRDNLKTFSLVEAAYLSAEKILWLNLSLANWSKKS